MSYANRIGSVRARLATLLVAAGGIGMMLYGLAALVACALNFLGVIGSAETRDPALIWFLVLWYPLWLLGGLLFSLAALRGRVLHLHRAASGALTTA